MTVSHPQYLNQLQSLMKSDTHIVIDFSAKWCGPCKRIAPEYDELSEDNKYKQWTFCKVDVDEAEDIAAYFNVSAMPTFIFIKNGAIADTFAGANIALLKSKLDSLA